MIENNGQMSSNKYKLGQIEASILDSFPDPIVIVDQNRNVLAANFPARELIGNDYLGLDLSMSIRDPNVLTSVSKTLESGQDELIEVFFPVPFSRTFNLRVINLSPSSIHKAEAILIFQDITATKRSEQMRVDFIANASHELRSPLAALLGFIETLRGSASDDREAQKKFLAIMQSEAERMTNLIDDLLSLSQVEFTEHLQPIQDVEVNSILNSAVDSLLGESKKRRIKLDISIDSDIRKVLGDENQLRQVIQNLLDNSLKYADQNSRIKVIAKNIDRVPQSNVSGVSITIKDKSDGIEQNDLPRLTERFYRVDKGRSRSLGGTGLGLAIVKHIVTRHRGHLKIDSKFKEGTIVTVSLPSDKL